MPFTFVSHTFVPLPSSEIEEPHWEKCDRGLPKCLDCFFHSVSMASKQKIFPLQDLHETISKAARKDNT